MGEELGSIYIRVRFGREANRFRFRNRLGEESGAISAHLGIRLARFGRESNRVLFRNRLGEEPVAICAHLGIRLARFGREGNRF